MTLDKDNTDKLAEFRAEAQRLGIKVAPPSANESEVDFDVRYDSSGAARLLYALSAIKGVGDTQARALVEARGKRPFASLSEVARRVDPRLVNKKALECLANAGAFDGLEPDRAAAFATVEPMLSFAQAQAEERAMGQGGLFGDEGAAPLKIRSQPWTAAERLSREFDAIGFFLSGHPLEAYSGALKRLEAKRWAEFRNMVRNGATTARLAASVLDRYERRTKTGSKLGVIQLSDPSGQYEAIIFQEGLALYRDLLEKGADVLLTLQANVEGEDIRARITHAESLSEAAARRHKGLRIFVRDEAPLPSIAERISGRGEGEISLVVMLGAAQGEVEMKLPGRYPVTGALAGALKAVAGVVAVEHV
jgi:DNA polymerase-3 subunit alpha